MNLPAADGVGDPDHYVHSDQPTACPRCQRRTPHTDLPDGSEHHTCGHCGYQFLMWPDFDGEEQCEHCRGFASLDLLAAGNGLCPECVTRGVEWSAEHDDYVTAQDRTGAAED